MGISTGGKNNEKVKNPFEIKVNWLKIKNRKANIRNLEIILKIFLIVT